MLHKIYKVLLNEYGHQGWWPLIEHNGDNPTKSGSVRGYHPKDYTFPKTSKQQFEICLGAILTQNTTWISAEKSLLNLHKHHLIDPFSIHGFDIEHLKDLIRPAGYFNQKSQYIRNMTNFFLHLQSESDSNVLRIPSRNEIMNIKGVGNETADCIMLYAFNQPEFVVDAYTKRIFSLFGFFDQKANYSSVKNIFSETFSSNNFTDQERVVIFQEYHALIVEHAKRFYSKRPYKKDPIISDCW
jgi:endonuclease-3 related protein